MVENEEFLIKQAQSGEPEGFGKLYDAHHHQIYRFIFLKVGSRAEAEDLTHQVFLSAWQNIKNYTSGGTPFKSWLYRIARNKVIDFYRLAKNNIALELVKDSVYANHDLELNLEESLALDEVRTAMQKLTSEQQDVMVMRFVEDMPIKEVAKIIGKTTGAVKLIQFRAIGKLKNILNHE